MKSFSWALAAAILASASLAGAQTPTRSDVSELVTVGRGEVRSTPDRATVVISIESHQGSAADASSENSRITTATLNAVKAAATPGDTITTDSYMVMPDYDKGKPKGFQARNTIRARLTNISRVGAVIDAALSSGATQVSQVQFSSSNGEIARRQALKLAVTQARLDAEALAEAAGGSVGKLLSVTSSGSIGVAGVQLRALATSAASIAGGTAYMPPVVPDDVTASAVATTHWEFVPRK